MSDTRVAVYIDFDNVVISRYDQVHSSKRDAWRSDNARDHAAQTGSDDPIAVKLAEATVDVGALLDYASSFGTVALARAYADWSVPANAAYRRQLVDRAVDLIQLFPVSGTKNGADIRLSVDAMEDLMQYADLTHVVIVGGDSDYIALAQRCKQLGRFVVGIGVTGSTSRALIAACDEFSSYDALPGVPTPAPAAAAAPAKKTAAKKTAAKKTTAQEDHRGQEDDDGQEDDGQEVHDQGRGEEGRGAGGRRRHGADALRGHRGTGTRGSGVEVDGTGSAPSSSRAAPIRRRPARRGGRPPR